MKKLILRKVCKVECGYMYFADEQRNIYSAYVDGGEYVRNRTLATINESGERDMPVFTKEFCEYNGIERKEYQEIEFLGL